MLNTNGLRIAQEPDFAERLQAAFKPGFEVYLQFDSLKPAALKLPARCRPHPDLQQSAGSP